MQALIDEVKQFNEWKCLHGSHLGFEGRPWAGRDGSEAAILSEVPSGNHSLIVRGCPQKAGEEK